MKRSVEGYRLAEQKTRQKPKKADERLQKALSEGQRARYLLFEARIDDEARRLVREAVAPPSPRGGTPPNPAGPGG